MGDFVVHHGKGPAGMEIRIAQACHGTGFEKIGVTKDPVWKNRFPYRPNGIIAKNHYVIPSPPGGIADHGDLFQERLQCPCRGGMMGAMPLEIVVECGQVG